jgi:DNA ligase-1
MTEHVTTFAELAAVLEALAREGGRLKKRAAIAETIRGIEQRAPGTGEAGLFAQYLAGLPFPEWDGRKLNAGGALLSRAVKEMAGADDALLAAAYRRHGDLGAAAFDLLHAKNPGKEPAGAALTLIELREAFAAMAAARTTAARTALLHGLMGRCSPLEAKYLLKLMLGDMRTGVKQSLVEEAIAEAASVPVAEVRHAVMLEADLADAVRRAFAGTLGEARMRLFHPLGFMLASPVDSAEEAANRFTGDDGSGTTAIPAIDAFLEDKYDGMRAQIHFGDPAEPGRVVIYSRNREDITASYPELEEAFAAAATEAAETNRSPGPTVLDGEILGWDFAAGVEDESGAPAVSARGLYEDHANSSHAANSNSGRALPFAVLGQRIGRKRVSDEMRSRVPVIFMAFDLMVDRGELILQLPLRERRSRLEALAERIASRAVAPIKATAPQFALFAQASEDAGPAENGQRPTPDLPRLLLSPTRVVQSAEDIDRAYAAARARSNEGVMLKSAGSIYQPGRRGLAWMKLKRELATLDVVITGAEYGNGRRAGTLSDYTFAVRGPAFPQTGELLNVGKAYSGVTDAEIAELTEFLKAHTLEDYGHFRTVEPLVVLEVAFNNVMRSDRHASGFALRFPRILRLRPDKPLAEIDTLARVEEVYQSQVDKPSEQSQLETPSDSEELVAPPEPSTET